MKEANCDLWTFPAHFRIVLTNGICTAWNGEAVMGAGCAAEAKQKYPALPKRLGGYLKQYGNRPFIFQDFNLITFPTKEDWKQKSIPAVIEESARKVVEIADKYGIESLVLPRPGCGKGGLKWEAVKPLLEGILDDRFTVVHLEGK